MLASTVKLGNDASGNSVMTPMKNMLPMANPDEIVWGGWDINGMNLGDAMKRSKVLDIDLQKKLYSHMESIKPLPSVYFPDFIAANQSERADNILTGSKLEQMEHLSGGRDLRRTASTKSLYCGQPTRSVLRASKKVSTTLAKISWQVSSVVKPKSAPPLSLLLLPSLRDPRSSTDRRRTRSSLEWWSSLVNIRCSLLVTTSRVDRLR
jgi:hypothetical protein